MTAVVLPHAPASASLARRVLIEELRSAGVARATVSDAALVVSELVGNAVRHAGPLPGGMLRAEWTVRGTTIDIAVTDGGSRARPRALHPDERSTGGRGLSIVEALSRAWGTRRARDGLTVWASLQRSPVGGPRDPRAAGQPRDVRAPAPPVALPRARAD